MKNKKHDTIYCLVPHYAKLNHLHTMYDAVVAWSKSYEDLCDYINQHETGIEFEIFVGDKKTLKKESPDNYELAELVFIHNQWTLRAYVDDLWEMASKKRDSYNNTIGVLSCIMLDEGTDKNDCKVLKKAIQIIEDYREMECGPIDQKILKENHELNQEWRDHL